MKILVSTSATARQQTNAKTVFGSKAVSILKALEEASKEKTLATPGLDAFLADLKLTGAAFETVSSKAAFTKAVAAAKAFVSAKTFTAKIAALKSLKYSGGSVSSAKSPSAGKGASFLPDEGIPKLYGDLTFYTYKKGDKVIIVPDDVSNQTGDTDAIEIPKSALPTRAVFDEIMERVIEGFMIGPPQFLSLEELCKQRKFTLRTATEDEIDRAWDMDEKLREVEDRTAKQSVPAKNLDELYDSLSELTNGDVTSDARLLTATIGKNKVSDLQGAADSDGQIGIVLSTPKHEVTILHKKEAPKLFAKVAKLAGLGTKSDYIIYADKSSDGPFYSETIKVVPGSAAAFKPQDSKTAFDHLKRLCN